MGTMRWLLLTACGACSFEHGVSTLLLDTDTPVEAAPDAGDIRVPPRYCDPQDANLVVCYELDGNTADESTHGLDATTSSVSFVPGRRGLAMDFGATSAADVNDSPLFDVTAI